jgi:cytochrome c oxidase subunit 2
MKSENDLLSIVLPVYNFFSFQSKAASNHSNNVDSLFIFLVWSSFAIFLAVVLPMLWFCIRYRKCNNYNVAESQNSGNNILEVIWTIVPILYVAVLFVWGFYGHLRLSLPPSTSKELKIIGQKWMWSVSYIDEEITVSGQGVVIGIPLNQPVKLTMSSQDVIHSFSVPNFRVKQDVVPGRYTTLWFKANKLGEYPVFCAEYCGDQHSRMLAKMKVMSKTEFTKWILLKKTSRVNLTPKQLGSKLYKSKGCIACHSIDGSHGIAPSFKHCYGSVHELADGTKIEVNDTRIREKLLEPRKDITKGFSPVMPSFKGQLSEKEIIGIIEYIKSIK